MELERQLKEAEMVRKSLPDADLFTVLLKWDLESIPLTLISENIGIIKSRFNL